MVKLLKYLWALPITVLGLLLLLLALPSRPHVARLRIGQTSALCAWGGWLSSWLRKHPLGAMSAASIGHVVIARNARQLCWSGAHELEHVRQTELWGIFMPFAYVLNGLWQLVRGKRFYRDNYFEVAAYRFGPERFDRRDKR
ncbi:hypothetical protein GCM10009007_01920 [Formosimonas limnophila]|uniref:Uncharacterized protein n=2 Tax=Formosimonas limnophila TaxID=1384487 RepID=A0A8J3CL57_9BURK|nr:hypothetical protein GCM10009007_01920 [Formosimonas limnophila]